MSLIQALFDDTSKRKPMTESKHHAYKLQQCEWYNQTPGELEHYDCTDCHNKGYIAKLNKDDDMVLSECSCMIKRRNMTSFIQSGLQTDQLTFATYIVTEEWQQNAKLRSMKFLGDKRDKWLYMAGQPGCGKTHLCTAVCTELIRQGRNVKYVVWRNLFHELQGLQYKEEEYRKKIREYQKFDVLYIDDFLKMFDERSKGAELNFAFEVINARYISGNVTVISSEFHIDRLAKLDRAIAGRIAQKASEYLIQIKYVQGRDHRMKGLEEN